MLFRTAVVVLAFAAAAIAADSVGAADKPREKTHTSIHAFYDSGTGQYGYRGRLRSPRRSCLPSRTVKLYNESGPDALGTTQSDNDGNWEARLPYDTLLGDYYVIVSKRELPRVICRKTTSKTVPAATP